MTKAIAYRFKEKQKTPALGIYPDVPLETARARHRAARQLLADGIDPALRREELRTTAVADVGRGGERALGRRGDRLRARCLSTGTGASSG